MLKSLFNKVAGTKACNFIKERHNLGQKVGDKFNKIKQNRFFYGMFYS